MVVSATPCEGCIAKLIATPCNSVAVRHQPTDVALTCRTDLANTPVTWSFHNITNLLFDGFDVNARHRGGVTVKADVDTGEFNLTLKSPDASSAGRYICLEPGTGQMASAHLTVLGEINSRHIEYMKCGLLRLTVP